MNRRNLPLVEVDEVERCRQVRRSIERQFATTDEFFDWLVALDKARLDREAGARKRKTQRGIKKAKAKSLAKPSPKTRKKS